MNTKTNKVCLILAFFATQVLLTSCSTNLTSLSQIDYPKTIPFFEPISLFYNGNRQLLDPQLQRAYTAAVDTTAYPMESCRGNIDITANVIQDSDNSSWYVPATVIPFWPVMPVDETWNYHMTVRIYCNGTLTYKAELDESEKIKAFWYGKLRSDLVNDASEAMHKRLLERLKYELKPNRNSDLNSGIS